VEPLRQKEGVPARIRYQKRINGALFYVEEVRTGRSRLAAKTFYKYPIGEEGEALRRTDSLSAPRSHVQDVPGTSPPTSEPIKGSASGNVNLQKGRRYPPTAESGVLPRKRLGQTLQPRLLEPTPKTPGLKGPALRAQAAEARRIGADIAEQRFTTNRNGTSHDIIDRACPTRRTVSSKGSTHRADLRSGRGAPRATGL
jgi:hypothetical protein